MLAKPSDHDLLLVVDVQNDFLPGGALAVPEGDAIVPLINALAQRFAHVALTQDWHVPGHLSFASSHAGGPVRNDHVALRPANPLAGSLRSRIARCGVLPSTFNT